MKLLTGKVLFGWKPQYIADESITATVEDAQRMGLSAVSMKVGSGVYDYPFNGYNLRPLRDALGTAGISVYGWHYVYGANNPLNEMRVAERRIEDLDLDGYEIDAESHYKNYAWTQASELMQRMMSLTSRADIPLGLTTYRYPVYHQDFPWRGFLKYCDYYVPQVYWQPSPSSPAVELDKTIKQWTAEAQKWSYAVKPFVPAGRVYIGDGYPYPGPPASEILQFLDVAKNTHACPAATFWSFDNLYTHYGGDYRMDAIASFSWDTGPPPPTDKEKLDKLWDHHPELH